MYFDRAKINNGESNPILSIDFDRYYEGQDLTVKWADEIAASPYNGDAWAWIRARIRAGNYLGIHTKDYIPFKTANNVNLKAEIAGINTYKNYGDTAVGNHIDFICRELWPTNHVFNKVNYNNGLIPTETVVSDGSATEYTLTKAMYAIDNIKIGSDTLTGYTYDPATQKITFTTAPAAGNMVVTGTGSEHPWLVSDLYHYVNSLAGHVPNGTGANPALAQVDYTADGIYFQLPTALKNVIVEKRAYLPKRYSASGLLNDDNAGGWANIGKLWLPSEVEVYGAPCWGGKGGYSTMGNNVQYPIFMGNMNRLKYKSGSRYYWWLLSSSSGHSTYVCSVYAIGYALYSGASDTNRAAPVCFRVS